MGFGQEYEIDGIKNFYTKIGSRYSNPHESDISKLIKEIANQKLSYLDLACGDGVVTRALVEVGCDNVEGCDPYLYRTYEAKTNKKCHTHYFDELGLITQKFDIIICSYALHLLPLSFLPDTLYQLSRMSQKLIILSPHKRPDINNYWELEKKIILNKTKMRIYKNLVI